MQPDSHSAQSKQSVVVTRMGRLWRSIRQDSAWPEEDRGRMKRVMNDLVLHLHPPRVNARAIRFTYTFGLGGAAILLIVIQVITGALLTFAYRPTVEGAYQSIVALETQVWFGQLIRNLHHWSANLLLVVAFLHLLRVFYTSAFRAPRRLNWELGLALLGLVIAANFTGYLLPWDQLSYWAVTVGTSLLSYVPLIGDALRQAVLGGPEVNGTTLTNFYSLHIMIIPLGLLVTGLYHIWRVRKARFTTPRYVGESDPEPIKQVTTLPHLVSREIAFGLCLLAILLAWATWIDAPLQQPANPGSPPDPTKSAWYFAGIQELLFHFHPFFGAFVIPVLAIGALIVLPFTQDSEDRSGVWFRSVRGRWMVLLSFVVGGVVTSGLVWLNASGSWHGRISAVPVFVSQGVLPAAIVLGLLVGYNRLMKRFGATAGEA